MRILKDWGILSRQTFERKLKRTIYTAETSSLDMEFKLTFIVLVALVTIGTVIEVKVELLLYSYEQNFPGFIFATGRPGVLRLADQFLRFRMN